MSEEKRKNGEEIKQGILRILKKKGFASIEEMRLALDSNWSTIRKYGNELVKEFPFVEKNYRQVFCGYKIKEIKLDKQEKEILKIFLSDAGEEGLSPESIKKYNSLRENWNKEKENEVF